MNSLPLHKKILRRLTSALLIALLVACARSEPSPEQAHGFLKFFGTPATDRAAKVIQLDDKSYVICGTQTTPENATDLLLVKTDKFGNQRWSKTFGDTLNQTSGDFCALPDGFLLLGTTQKPDQTTDMLLVKTNLQGETLWQKNIGSPYNENGSALTALPDGSFALTGSTTRPNTANSNPAGTRDMFLAKTNDTGDTLWTKAYGSSATDYATDIKTLPGGGLVLCGTTNGFAEPGQALYNIFLVTTNSLGAETDKYTYGSAQNDIESAIEILPSGGFAIAATSQTTDANAQIYALGLGENIHQILWEQRITCFGQSTSYDIIATENGFAITGSCTQDAGTNRNALLLKLNQQGDPVDSKTFGGEGDETGKSIFQTQDKGFVICGEAEFSGNSMIMLLKINAQGNLPER